MNIKTHFQVAQQDIHKYNQFLLPNSLVISFVCVF